MHVRIVPLTPEIWPALAELFEEGGDPKWCWCMYWRSRSADMGSDGEVNRRRLESLVGFDPAPGLVALEEDGRAVGWVSLGPRERFQRLERSRVRPRIDDVPVWAIVCFVVARRARGAGLAGRLLTAAIDYARAHGAPALEAYPVDASQGRPSSATLYSGTLSTFERAGFRVVATAGSAQATVVRNTVRLDLSL